ncbi:hypothetical protein COCSUDRAFT_83594 [Coccomyxa subellipsoidea C-169]|uniref:Uncharacterized protein n=1 Tax=Coccomyxa subellipsoidea (strain C-169) TaxID=574566 RepID=I0YLH7_COCSC|nr:hypothetical protein COCSUDRAFT_83594 [Coccomyxa subellipsoidea C-169]EIE19246.1 hypothetical protein COCSUDRAFT_83594 [Coccomyxa subellipsoidea C-169]|eukprot:XP_005643790.1 hypothetical protein COCSUDRAFT_83594 [Coccomyxa subellipsoidea C-169]
MFSDQEKRTVIKVLLNRGADISTKDDQSHLVTADLLEAGAPLEAVDEEGRTPLLAALDGNRKEAIDVLIAAGVKATAMVLLKAGADAQVTDKLGRRALDVAEDGAHMKLAEFLRQWQPAPAFSSPPPASLPDCSSPAAPAASQGGLQGSSE